MGAKKDVINVEAKLSTANARFLEQWSERLQPLEVSPNALIEVSVGIVRMLHAKGKLSLEPEALRELFATEHGESK